jgi:ABC-type sugar transport system permease subunit
MNARNLWIAALSGAALTTLISNLPYLGFVNCLAFAGFWGSAIFGVWLYQRLSGPVTTREGTRLGALTGLLAGGLGFALSFVGLAGMQGLMNNTENLLPPEALQGADSIPAWGAIVFNLVGVVFNVVFGTIGGWMGAVILNRSRKAATQGAVP